MTKSIVAAAQFAPSMMDAAQGVNRAINILSLIHI